MSGRAVVYAAIAALLSALVVLPLDPQLTYVFHHDISTRELDKSIESATYSRQTIAIQLQQYNLSAWLYLPKATDAPPPVIVMGQGIGNQKDSLLTQAFSREFVAHGLAVLSFDYRTFGHSDGTPRHWVSPARHVQDWVDVVQHVQRSGLGGVVDHKRVALWGVSYAGGHVLVASTKLGPDSVTAVVSHIPFLSGKDAALSSLKSRGVLGTLRMLYAGIHDRLRSAIGLPPAYVPLVALPGALAVMNLAPDQLALYQQRIQPNREGGWQPKALARISLEASGYEPMAYLPRVQAPVLLVGASLDPLCPPHLIRQAAEILGPRAEVLERNATHWGIGEGEHLHAVSQRMVQFLKAHLRPAATAAAAAAAAPVTQEAEAAPAVAEEALVAPQK